MKLSRDQIEPASQEQLGQLRRTMDLTSKTKSARHTKRSLKSSASGRTTDTVKTKTSFSLKSTLVHRFKTWSSSSFQSHLIIGTTDTAKTKTSFSLKSTLVHRFKT
jgi:hypothetical protein